MGASHFDVNHPNTYETIEKPATSEADGKCPDVRLLKSRGIDAKERYLQEAYIALRCSDSPC